MNPSIKQAANGPMRLPGFASIVGPAGGQGARSLAHFASEGEKNYYGWYLLQRPRTTLRPSRTPIWTTLS
jgi:hypothetical protein